VEKGGGPRAVIQIPPRRVSAQPTPLSSTFACTVLLHFQRVKTLRGNSFCYKTRICFTTKHSRLSMPTPATFSPTEDHQGVAASLEQEHESRKSSRIKAVPWTKQDGLNSLTEQFDCQGDSIASIAMSSTSENHGRSASTRRGDFRKTSNLSKSHYFWNLYVRLQQPFQLSLWNSMTRRRPSVAADFRTLHSNPPRQHR
jgi:hypothetical protein